MMATVNAMSARQIFCCSLRGVLISILALSGCTNEEAGGPEKKSQTAPQSTHKEVGKASWYGPGFNGHETSSSSSPISFVKVLNLAEKQNRNLLIL